MRDTEYVALRVHRTVHLYFAIIKLRHNRTIAREERDAVERPDRVKCGDRFGNNRPVNAIETASHAGRDVDNG